MDRYLALGSRVKWKLLRRKSSSFKYRCLNSDYGPTRACRRTRGATLLVLAQAQLPRAADAGPLRRYNRT